MRLNGSTRALARCATAALFAIWITGVALPSLSVWQHAIVALAVAIAVAAVFVLIAGEE